MSITFTFRSITTLIGLGARLLQMTDEAEKIYKVRQVVQLLSKVPVQANMPEFYDLPRYLTLALSELFLSWIIDNL